MLTLYLGKTRCSVIKMFEYQSMETKKYKIEIDSRILELLGPNLYTNIYYVLAELIANAYDADAHNVYIISEPNAIRVEDDGHGMSYSKGGIAKYLGVAKLSRTNATDSLTELGRQKWVAKESVSLLHSRYRRMSIF